jgi:hypothetical protein
MADIKFIKTENLKASRLTKAGSVSESFLQTICSPTATAAKRVGMTRKRAIPPIHMMPSTSCLHYGRPSSRA